MYTTTRMRVCVCVSDFYIHAFYILYKANPRVSWQPTATLTLKLLHWWRPGCGLAMTAFTTFCRYIMSMALSTHWPALCTWVLPWKCTLNLTQNRCGIDGWLAVLTTDLVPSSLLPHSCRCLLYMVCRCVYVLCVANRMLIYTHVLQPSWSSNTSHTVKQNAPRIQMHASNFVSWYLDQHHYPHLYVMLGAVYPMDKCCWNDMEWLVCLDDLSYIRVDKVLK